MTTFVEKEGMTRRQFFKGTGMVVVAAVITGVFAKIGFDVQAVSDDYIAKRGAGLYNLDESMALRKSHLNPEIAQIYKDYLSPGEVKPLTAKSEHLLHTRYGSDVPALIEELKNPNKAAEHEAA